MSASWLEEIGAVKRVFGQGKSIWIEVSDTEVSQDDYEDFIAIFMRYKIDMKQLASLVPAESESWFKNPQRVWYKKIFG